MAAHINYHPRPTSSAGSRMIYAAALAAALIVVLLIVGMPSKAPGEAQWQQAATGPNLVLPLDPTFAY